jgi:hypothetical protein
LVVVLHGEMERCHHKLQTTKNLIPALCVDVTAPDGVEVRAQPVGDLDGAKPAALCNP